MKDAPSAESQRIFTPGLFSGQTAIITGGGSGIGLATALELVRLGAKVAICGRNEEKLATATHQLEQAHQDTAVQAGDTVYAAPCDIREPEHIDTFVEEVMERMGSVDILVNNAGGQFPAPAEHMSPKGFNAVVRNNLVGTFQMTRAVATKSMIPARNGRIINVIANIYRGFPGMMHTGAARAGVENMTMSLAVEWSRYGILVNAVAPGMIHSSGVAQYPPMLVERTIAAVPLRRAGTVEEVAASIIFLASPGAQFITGATLRIDGAQSLWGDVFPLQ